MNRSNKIQLKKTDKSSDALAPPDAGAPRHE